MIMAHRWTALVTLLALTFYFFTALRVGRARGQSGIKAPAMTGDPILERAVRVQANTLEFLPLFLGGLWLFALYGNDIAASLLGLVWIAGRLLYATTYLKNPEKRGPGFMIQFLATVALIIGAFIEIIASFFG